MDLFKKVRSEIHFVPISPIELDRAELRNVDIRREWQHIDLLIKCESPRFIVAIENKIDSSEHGDQLVRYRTTVEKHFPQYNSIFVYLTKQADEPSDEQWCVYSYEDICRTLRRVRNTQQNAIGKDVLTFLDHYLNVIENRFMDNPMIENLCRGIYNCHEEALKLISDSSTCTPYIKEQCDKIRRNHQQALGLIFDHVGIGSPTADLINLISESIQSEFGDQLLITKKTDYLLEFVPQSWSNFFS